jgi:hypothetical protein
MKPVTHLFPDFLGSREQYDVAAKYVIDLCRSAIRDRKGNVGDWEPWMGIHRERSVTLVEEGSIASLYSPIQNKGLSIELYAPSTDSLSISAFADVFGQGALDRPIPYLTIACELSNESASVIRNLVRHWSDEAVKYPEILRLIPTILKDTDEREFPPPL